MRAAGSTTSSADDPDTEEATASGRKGPADTLGATGGATQGPNWAMTRPGFVQKHLYLTICGPVHWH
jgi:hypothetical protein